MHALLNTAARQLRFRLAVIGVLAAALVGLVGIAPSNAAPSNPSPGVANSTTTTAAERVSGTAAQHYAARDLSTRNYYASIAFNYRNRIAAWDYNYRTRRGAVLVALHSCQRHSGAYYGYCRKVGWVRNGCIALRIHWNGYYYNYAGGYGRTRHAAYHAAYRRLPHSRRFVSSCTAGHN